MRFMSVLIAAFKDCYGYIVSGNESKTVSIMDDAHPIDTQYSPRQTSDDRDLSLVIN